MSKLYKYPQKYFTREHFYSTPLTITFYRENNKILRVKDVSHLLPLEDKLYLFGVGIRYEQGKYVITKDEYDCGILESDFEYNYQFCKNMLRDLKKGRSGLLLSKRIEKTFSNYCITFLPYDFKDWVEFILKHYNYGRYYLTETLNLDESSKDYLTIEMKLKERNKLWKNTLIKKWQILLVFHQV